MSNYICPKCHDYLTVEKKPFVETNQPLYKVGCHNCGAYGASVLGEEKAYAEFMRYMEKDDRRKILTDIRDYLVAILDEWHRRSDEPNFLENNIMVYNHLRKELDDLTEYAEKLGVEL